MYKRKFLATLALSAVVLNTINFTVLEDWLGTMQFVPKAEAAHSQGLHCNPIPNTGATQYTVDLACWDTVVKPAGDTGATHMHLGIHTALPNQFLGGSGPDFICKIDNGGARLNCKNFNDALPPPAPYNNIPPGSQRTIDFFVRVTGQCGTTQALTSTVANVYGVNSTPETYTYAFPACPPPPPAPASFATGTKTGPNTIQPGQTISYNINFTNGGGTAQSVRIADVVPPGLTYVAAGSTGGCALNGGVVFCPFQNVGPGGNISAVLNFTVGANVPCNAIIDNAADLQNAQNQSFQWTNHKQTTVQCPGPVFPQGTKTGPNTIQPGQDITYQIAFTNGGTTQQNIRIADVIPPGLTFKPAGSTAGCAVNGGVVFCPAQTVNAGQQITATLVFTVGANVPCNAIIDNAADLQQNNNSFQWTNHKQTTVQCPGPVFPQGTKTGPNTIQPGQDITYQISFTNQGTTQQNIRIADVVPPGLTFKTAGSTAGCAVNGGVVFCPAQTVNAGQQITATLVFTVAANAACNAIIDNVADLQQNNQSFQWTAHKQTQIVCPGPVFPQGTKTGPDTIQPGQNLTYQISFTNQGTTQQNIRIADVVPPGLTFVQAGSTAGCAVNGGVVFCPAQTVNAGQQITATLVFTVAANAACNAIIDNVADLQQNNQSFQWTNHKQTQIVCPGPNFPQGTKTGPNTIQPGQDLTYQISFTNQGTTQQNIRIADVVPPGLTFKTAGSTAGCAVNGGVVFCPAQTVNAGQTISATLVFTVAANAACNAIIDNVADLQQNNQSFQWTNHKQTQIVCPGPNFPQGTKTAPATVVRGENLTYQISFTNQGTTQQNIRIADVIPPGLTFVQAGSTAGCAVNGGVVFCPAQTVNAGQQITATLVFTVAANAPCNGIIDNVADLQQNNQSFQWTNHAQTTIQCPVTNIDLSLVKNRFALTPLVPGSIVTYDLEITNNGPATTYSAVVTDAIPAGTTFVPNGSTAGCTQQGNNVVCTLTNVNHPVGTRNTITLRFQIPANAACGPNTNIVNTATVTVNGVTDTNTANNTSQVTSNVTCPAPQFTGTKSTDKTVALRGDTLTYTIVFTNNGQTAQQDIRIADVIPAGLTFVTAGSTAGCAAANGVVFCPAQTVNPGAQITATLKFQVTQNAACNQVIDNVADLQQANASFAFTNHTQTQVQCPVAQADLAVQKTVSTPQVNVGTDVTFTVSVTNNGPAPSEQVVLNDVLPAGLTYVSHATATGTYNPNSGVWTIGTMAPGQTVTLQIAATVASVGPKTNTATVTALTADPNLANNTASATVTGVQPNPQFTGTKAVDKTVAQRGEVVTYTITFTNTGNTPQQNIRITDTVPAGLTFQTAGSTAGCTLNGNVVQCQPQTVNAGQTITATLKFTVNQNAPCNAPITNVAVLQQGTQDIAVSNQVSTVVQCPVDQADIRVSKTVNNAQVNVGTDVTFTITVANDGPSAAQGVVANDLLPAGLTYVTHATATGTYNPNSGVWTIGTLNAGQSVTLSLVATVATAGAKTNTVTATAQTPDPNAGNNTASVTVNGNQQGVDLSLTKTKTDPTVIVPGSVVTYDIAITNNGPGTQYSAVITDAIPTGTTFVPAGSTAGCAVQGANVVCTLTNVTQAVGSTNHVTLKFQVPANAACGPNATIVNSASIALNGVADPNNGNNNSSVTSNVSCPAPSFTVSKTGPAVAAPNGTIFYTITATNNGQTAQQDIRIADVVPAGLTFTTQNSTAGCAVTNGVVFCPAQTVQPGQSISATLYFTVNPAVACNTTIDNVADIQQGGVSFAWSNHTNLTIQCQAPQLYVVKTAPNALIAGQNATYNFTLQNTSAFPAQSVEVADFYTDANGNKIAPPISFVSSQGLACSYEAASQSVKCNAGTLQANQTISFSMTFAVPSDNQALCNTTVYNRVTAISAGLQASQDADTATAAVQCNTVPPQFTIVKSGPEGDSVSPGEVITYLIAVQNTGTSAQQNIRLVDAIPAGLTFEPNGSTAGCTAQNNQVTCPAQTFTAGQSFVYALKFRLNDNAQCNGNISNTAALQQNNVTFITSNAVQTNIDCAAKLDITKTAPPTSTAGQTVTYTFVVRNNNTTAQQNVNVYDFFINANNNQIDMPFTFVSSAGVTCNNDAPNRRIVCPIGTMAPGQQLTFTATFSIPNNTALCGQTIINQVDVWPGDRQDLADWDKAMTTVQCQANSDVSIQKTGPATLQQGQNISYVVTVTNAGPGAAQNISFTDPVPTGLTFVNATGAQCTNANNAVTCAIGTLTAGQNLPVTLNFATQQPPANNCQNISVQNTVTLTATGDTTPNNNTSTSTTTLTCPVTNADVGVTKTVNNAAPTVGQQVTFTITATNNGPATAQNVRVTDQLPAGLTYVSSTPSTGTYNQTNGVWTIGTMNTGATATLQITATAATAGTVTNTATVAADTPDTVTANNSASVNVVIGGGTAQIPDLSVTKTTSQTTVNRGENITYLVTAVNNGPGTANNVVIKDTFSPTGTLTYVSASGAQCSLTGTSELTCTIASMTAGQQVPVTITFSTQQATGTCTTATVTNSATIATNPATNDPNTGNNTSQTTSTTLNCPQPNLNVTKTDGRSSANVGDNISYTITITNSSSIAATNVTVTDTLPSGLSNVNAGNGGSVNGTQVTWNNQTVPANGQLTLTVNGTVQNVSNGTILTNYVNVTGTNLTGNLSASDQTTVYSSTVYNPPPIYNPPCTGCCTGNCPQPPVYQPPVYNQPPLYQPPVYTPPSYKPIFPQTGTTDLYATPENTDQYLSDPVAAKPEETPADNFNLIFFATLAGVFAVGSAAAAKFAGGAGIF